MNSATDNIKWLIKFLFYGINLLIFSAFAIAVASAGKIILTSIFIVSALVATWCILESIFNHPIIAQRRITIESQQLKELRRKEEQLQREITISQAELAKIQGQENTLKDKME